MSPEERAAAIRQELFRHPIDEERILARAIREAENEALERAAETAQAAVQQPTLEDGTICEGWRPELPEGIDITLNFYLTSPSTGMDTCVHISGVTRYAPIAPKPVQEMAEAAGLGELASDWRYMTRDEIRAYKERDDDE